MSSTASDSSPIRCSQVATLLNGTPNREDARLYLPHGDYVFEVYEERNAEHNRDTGGLACFDVRVE